MSRPVRRSVEVLRRHCANGIEMICAPLEGFATSALAVTAHVGSRHEDPTTSGMSHFLEHMAFKGTSKRSAMEIALDIEILGADINAFTSRERTAYHISGLGEHFSTHLEILSDVLTDSTFPNAEIEVERGVILQEIARAKDTAGRVAYDAMSRAAWPDQPFGRPVLGCPDVVSSASADNFRSWISRHYRGGNMTISCAGAVDPEFFFDEAERLFSKVPPGGGEGFVPSSWRGGHVAGGGPFAQCQAYVGLPGPKAGGRDEIVADLAAGAFGGGMSSPLFQEIREKRGLAYSVSSHFISSIDGGCFVLAAGTDPTKIGEFAEESTAALAAFSRDPGPRDVERARNGTRARLLTLVEKPMELALELAEDLRIHGRHVPLEEKIAEVESVGTEEIGAFCRGLADKTFAVGTAGPEGGADLSSLLSAGLSR